MRFTWTLSAAVALNDRVIEYDPASGTGTYPAAIDFIGQMLVIDDEVMEIVGSPDAPTVGWIVNRALWFTTQATHANGSTVRIIDIHRESLSFSPGALIELFEFDASKAGDTLGPYRFVNGFQTTRSLTDLVELNKAQNLFDKNHWTYGADLTVSVNSHIKGEDGVTPSFEISGAVQNESFFTNIPITQNGLSYHYRFGIYPKCIVMVEIVYTAVTGSKTYRFCIDDKGQTFAADGTHDMPTNIEVFSTEEGFYIVEFDALNTGSVSTSNLTLAFYPGFTPSSRPTNDNTMYNTPWMRISAPSIYPPSGYVFWGGNTYTPLPIMSSGFEQTTRGALPTPRIKVANGVIGNALATLIDEFDDLVGCTITRFRTFTRHLDTGSEPDVHKHYRPDVFTINRKVSHNKLYIEWELATAIDQQGAQLPGRVYLRDYCPWQYRKYLAASSSFDYTNVECPYTGSTYYDANDNLVTDPAKDACSKHLTGCILRFGSGNELPYGGFPGVSLWR